MQNTGSDRFSSIKKDQPGSSIKANKFSSSGIGNFGSRNASIGRGQTNKSSTPTPTNQNNATIN